MRSSILYTFTLIYSWVGETLEVYVWGLSDRVILIIIIVYFIILFGNSLHNIYNNC